MPRIRCLRNQPQKLHFYHLDPYCFFVRRAILLGLMPVEPKVRLKRYSDRDAIYIDADCKQNDGHAMHLKSDVKHTTKLQYIKKYLID